MQWLFFRTVDLDIRQIDSSSDGLLIINVKKVQTVSTPMFSFSPASLCVGKIMTREKVYRVSPQTIGTEEGQKIAA